MPIYEYYCAGCLDTFEQLRGASQADDPVKCPSCESTSPQRILSLFASSVKASHAEPVPSMPMGGGCCGGACGCGH